MSISYSSITELGKSMQTSQLEEKLTGKDQVIVPGSENYDVARKGWNLAVDQFPALIVRAKTVNDIVAAIRFAKSNGLEVAVMATGHGVIRSANNSLLIDTSQMNQVRVNASAKTAWVEAGAKWGIVLKAAQAEGLAPLLGSSPDVGAVGYTLGGGMGWLARKYGLSTDSVNFFELVTADGDVIKTSASTNADLFWALRGGGGNFGVVTGMEIRLYPVTNVYAGNLYYPADMAKEVFANFRNWIKDAPKELTASFVVMNFPPLEIVPDFMRGKSYVMVRGCYCGEVADGEALVNFWRSWQTPFIDDFKQISFKDAANISNDPVDPIPALSSGTWLKDLDDDVIDRLIDFVLPHGNPPLLMMSEIRNAGGVISEVDPQSAAYGNRDAEFSLQFVAAVPNAEINNMVTNHISRLKDELKPHLHGGVYMNFLEGAEARERTRQGYSAESFKRLQAVKKKFDPQNMFSHSYYIPPED